MGKCYPQSCRCEPGRIAVRKGGTCCGLKSAVQEWEVCYGLRSAGRCGIKLPPG
jgi:hypothetical protein